MKKLCCSSFTLVVCASITLDCDKQSDKQSDKQGDTKGDTCDKR
jgi:hypothetical protein